MTSFVRSLSEFEPEPGERRWVYVPYDQLSAAVGPLSEVEPSGLGIVMVENPWKAHRRPYHKQKLALILANGRHFAYEQARRGVAVRFLVADGPYRSALEPIVSELGPLQLMRPAERELREDLRPLVETGGLVEIELAGARGMARRRERDR